MPYCFIICSNVHSVWRKCTNTF